MNMSERKIWVGTLASYNRFDLLGDWFDADAAPTDAGEWVRMMHERGDNYIARTLDSYASDGLRDVAAHDLAKEHEELWVFDHEGFGAWLTGECSPAEAQRIDELMTAIEDSGANPDAVAEWAMHEGEDLTALEWDGPTRERFEESFAGEWGSEVEYAEALADDLGMFDNVSDGLRTYFDFERFTDDLFAHDYYAAGSPNGIYVFRVI